MPPRYAYWTILVDGGPTAFRAAEPDELLPTLKRLQVKQPGAVMKWFEKGRLWESRDEAREKLGAGYTVGADGALVPPAEGAAARTKSWRPGGEHRDPREKYQLAKKAKWQKFKQMVRSRPGHGRKPLRDEVAAPFEEREPKDPVTVDLVGSDADSFEPAGEFDHKPSGDDGFDDTSAPAPPSSPASDWRGRPKPSGTGAGRPPARARAWSDRPKFGGRDDRPRGPKPEWRGKPQGEWRGKPGGAGGGARPAWKPRPDGGRGPKPEWRDRGPKTFDRGGDRPRGPKPEWRDKPQGEWRGKPGGAGDGARPAWKPRPDGGRGPKPEWRDRGPKTFDRGGDRPRGPRPEWRDKPEGERRAKPGGTSGGGRPAWKPRPEGARGAKPEWRDRGPKTFDRGGDRPRGPKPEWRDRGPKTFDRGDDARPRGPKPEWSDRPKTFSRDGERPGGARPRGPKPGGGKPGGFGPGPKRGGFGAKGRGRSGPPRPKKS